jgi:type I restriction enzyme S subunit
MASEWPLRSVESLTEKVAMGPFGSNIKVSTFVDRGVPVISGEHLHGTRMQDGRFNFITEEHAQKLKNSLVKRGDVVFTHAGNIGQAAVIPNTSRYPTYIISQRQFYARCKRDLMMPEYLAYFFHSPDGRHKLLSNASQVGVPSIARPSSHLKSIEVPTPPLSYQKSVVEILEAVETRINQNHALAANLEAIARRLFKSWFVDFDPVRAKVAGEDPVGLADDIAALFPDRFVESELGEIPEGWKVGTLEDVCELNPETWSTKKHPEILEYIDLSNVKSGCIEEATSYAWNESPSRARRVLRFGDTIVGTVRPGNRSFALIATDGLTGSTGFAVLRPSHRHHREYLYLAATSDDAIDRLAHLADGAAYPAVRPDVVTGAEVVIPNDEIMKQLSVITCPMFDQIAVCHSEDSALSSLRDLLLPRLISGKLRVADAESLIEEAIA